MSAQYGSELHVNSLFELHTSCCAASYLRWWLASEPNGDQRCADVRDCHGRRRLHAIHRCRSSADASYCRLRHLNAGAAQWAVRRCFPPFPNARLMEGMVTHERQERVRGREAFEANWALVPHCTTTGTCRSERPIAGWGYSAASRRRNWRTTSHRGMSVHPTRSAVFQSEG